MTKQRPAWLLLTGVLVAGGSPFAMSYVFSLDGELP